MAVDLSMPILVVDDYASRKCPGVRLAADEFVANHSDYQV